VTQAKRDGRGNAGQGTKRDRRESARAAIAAQRAAEAARRRNLIIAGSAVGVVLIAVIVLAAVALTGGTKKKAAPATLASQDLITQVTSVPAATLDSIGKGKIQTVPTATTGKPVATADGKPLVFYFGAEFCPYCAAERLHHVPAEGD